MSEMKCMSHSSDPDVRVALLADLSELCILFERYAIPGIGKQYINW
jgi:hypothetical protein